MDALQIHISRQISEQKSQTVTITDQRGEKIWEGSIKPHQLLAAIKGWKPTKKNPSHLQIPGTKAQIPMPKDKGSIQIVAEGKSAELGRISLFPVRRKKGANVKQVENQINTLFSESRKVGKASGSPRAEAPTPPPVEETKQEEVQVQVKAEPKRGSLFKKLAASLAAIASVTGAGYLGFPHLGEGLELAADEMSLTENYTRVG